MVIFTPASSALDPVHISGGTTRIIMADPPNRASVAPKQKNSGAHKDSSSSFGVVYANEAARHALMDEKKPRFPAGSIIIREKLARAGDAKPLVLVAMVKHGRGFNPKANDWEFLVINGSASAIQRREKIGDCLACHKEQKKTDFVFRYYLPEDVRRRQR